MRDFVVCGKCKTKLSIGEDFKFTRFKCSSCGSVNETVNVSLKEWLGFNYSEYVESILEAIDEDDFDLLAAKDSLDLERGKLSSIQVQELKDVLSDAFENGDSIRDIRNRLLEDVRVRDLKVLSKEGDVVRTYPRRLRALMIARTETTRLSNLGSQKRYEKGDVKNYRWTAAVSDRTCPVCEGLNGSVFELRNGPVPPAHVNCRCTITPVVEGFQ